MDPENLGAKIFLFVATAKLRTLHIVSVEHEIDEVHLMDLLAVESGWPPDLVYQARRFHDPASTARYEMETRKPGWEWRSIPKSSGLALWNEALWKRARQHEVETVIIRAGKSEWRVYKVKGQHR